MTEDFDIASAQYDTAFTFSKIGKAQRKMVFKYLNPILTQRQKLSILELNCGTGEDAIRFAQLGHHVLATDISEGMINVAKAKSHSKNLAFKIQDINTLDRAIFKTKFDIIFSNFGGFNCLSHQQIQDFFETAPQLLKPKGKIILVIMPKKSLWECLYFTLKGQLNKANRRRTNTSIVANVEGIKVDTWYHNPDTIVSASTSNFIPEQIRPIGLSIPPSYLESSIFANRLFISIYLGIDYLLTHEFWSEYADHCLIELTKTS